MTTRRSALRAVAISLATLVIIASLGVVGAVWLEVRQGPPRLTVAQVAANVERSVVTVEATVWRDGTTEGSGFFYGTPGHIVTSAHVLARATSVTIIDATGARFSTNLVGIDWSRDVAVLTTSDVSPKPLAPAKDPASAGSQVLIVGNRWGTLPITTFSLGSVGGTDRQVVLGGLTYVHLMQIDAVAQPANRGGPIVSTTGRLLGMVTTTSSGDAFAIPRLTFDAEVASWEIAGHFLALGPPPVTAAARSLLLATSGDWSWVRDEAWGGTGWHYRWTRPPTYVYGGTALDIYLKVAADDNDAISQFQFSVNEATNRGYTNAGPVDGLGDEASAFSHSDSGQVTYEVIWRDRNCAVSVYLGSGIPARSDITMDTALSVAKQQEVAIAANLANYQ